MNNRLTFNDLPEAVHFLAREISDLKDLVRQLSPTAAQPLNVAPILSSKQVQEMTGWPNGTFYAKVAEMPEGVVIRKSKRLLFDRENLMVWLKTPARP